jgi:hypothetical protein
MPAPTPAQHDELVFVDEAPAAPGGATDPGAWRVMIVDDDADVHSTTTFALGSLEVQDRRWLSCTPIRPPRRAPCSSTNRHRGHPARRRHGRSGRRPAPGAPHPRNPGRHDVRIILRTGQPGYAPEMDAIRGYDINDYRTKSELTRTKLYTSVAAAIRAYEQIRALETSRRGLAEVVRANAELMALRGVGAWPRSACCAAAACSASRPPA